MKKSRKKWLIIVNAITSLRIIGSAFLFPIYFKYGQNVMGIILTVLFLTDWIDGYLARKYNVSTFFGSIMDSICDKVMAIVSCIILCFINKYFIISIILELLIFFVNTFVLTQKGNIKSSLIGKGKMWVLSICVILGFFLSKDGNAVVNLSIAIPAIIAELVTLYDYLKKGSKVKIEITTKKPNYKSFKEIKKMLFSPEFYELHKDDEGLITHIYKNE